MIIMSSKIKFITKLNVRHSYNHYNALCYLMYKMALT